MGPTTPGFFGRTEMTRAFGRVLVWWILYLVAATTLFTLFYVCLGLGIPLHYAILFFIFPMSANWTSGVFAALGIRDNS